MSLDGEIEQESQGHIATADALHARIAETGCEFEVMTLEFVINGIPPEISAASHPENFGAGKVLPDAENSCMVSYQGGLYSNGALAVEAKNQFAVHNPEFKITPDVSANTTGLTSQFGLAADENSITSLAVASSKPVVEEETPVVKPNDGPMVG